MRSSRGVVSLSLFLLNGHAHIRTQRRIFARGWSHSARVQHKYNTKGIGGLARYRRWPCRRQFTPSVPPFPSPLTPPANSLRLPPTYTNPPFPLFLILSHRLSVPSSLSFWSLPSYYRLPSHTARHSVSLQQACLSFHPISLFVSRAVYRVTEFLSTPSMLDSKILIFNPCR